MRGLVIVQPGLEHTLYGYARLDFAHRALLLPVAAELSLPKKDALIVALTARRVVAD